MRRHSIYLDDSSDPARVVEQVEAYCRGAGLDAPEVMEVVTALREPLRIMIQSGRDVASVGGQFRGTREVEAGPVAVTLVARFGIPPSLFARLRRALTRKV
jgi:hypothetical protein